MRVYSSGGSFSEGWSGSWLEELFKEDPLVHPYRWLRPYLVPPALFIQCKPYLTPGGSAVLADPARIDASLCRSGQREASLEEMDAEVDGWLPLLWFRNRCTVLGDWELG